MAIEFEDRTAPQTVQADDMERRKTLVMSMLNLIDQLYPNSEGQAMMTLMAAAYIRCGANVNLLETACRTYVAALAKQRGDG